jgi:hypothetical protein
MALRQACRCSHGKSIHYPKHLDPKVPKRCYFPGCTCKNYRPTKS